MKNCKEKQKNVKVKQMENMLMKMHKQDQILQKSLDISRKKEKSKQEFEEFMKYKQETILDQIQQRHQLINKYASIV
ncbi:hypothetical protein pb186bvf_006067 [Paramecium bursaria]